MMVVDRFVFVCDTGLSPLTEIGPHVLSHTIVAGHDRRIVVATVISKLYKN